MKKDSGLGVQRKRPGRPRPGGHKAAASPGRQPRDGKHCQQRRTSEGSRPRLTANRSPASILVLLTVTLGCASLKMPSKNQLFPDPQKERKEQVARQFDQNRDRAEFEAALAAWEREELNGCEATLRAILERNGEHRDARLMMIDVCLAGRRTPEAARHAELALKAHPDDAQVQYAMALLLDSTQRRGEALAYYERATKLDPKNEVYAVGYHTALQAERRPGVAVASSDDSDRAERQSAPARAEKAGPAKAAGNAAPDGLFQRGVKALEQHEPEVALIYFREAAAQDPHDPQIPISAATAALRFNQPDVAVELLRPAETRFPNSAAVKRILGAAYYRLGDYRASQVALQQALSLDKSSALSYFLMGCTLRKLDRLPSAEEHFRQAGAIDARYAVRR